jgi:hypothetical protein
MIHLPNEELDLWHQPDSVDPVHTSNPYQIFVGIEATLIVFWISLSGFEAIPMAGDQ